VTGQCLFLVLKDIGMQLETRRLRLTALNYDQLLLCMKADGSLEQNLGIKLKPGQGPLELSDSFIKRILPKVRENSSHYYYCSIWTVIVKDNMQLAGDICFKGMPNSAGEIEVGYASNQEFRGKGLMTEALDEISKWALRQSDVTAITAKTRNNNIASEKVLHKSGYVIMRTMGDIKMWRLENKQK
jgi:[ribosomal protein S5]-alanine N-acetyltransferase